MKYFIFIDCPNIARIAISMANGADRLIIGVGDLAKVETWALEGETIGVDRLTAEFVDSLGIKPEDRIIIGACEPDLFSSVTESFLPGAPSPSILFVSEKPVSGVSAARPNVSVVNLVQSSMERLEREWRYIELRKKAFQLWSMLKDAGRVLILTQHDPDPDAIASGMALRELLAADETSAPICTFGGVTRNENRAMLRLLGVKVRRIIKEDVEHFDKVVMVDVQPPYFKRDRMIDADVVIDHHPYPGECAAKFCLVDSSYGATSTIMAELLSASGMTIKPKLATALLYGVITDTMLLARESSNRDFEAFNMLWPLADQGLLAAMSRPRLSQEELDYFIKAITERMEIGSLLFIWLGETNREDIIPRIADFSLQIGDTSLCAVAGVNDGNVVISIRNVDPELDAGIIAGLLFKKYGSAGGHRTMAKAVIKLDQMKKELGINSLDQVRTTIWWIFQELEDGSPGFFTS